MKNLIAKLLVLVMTVTLAACSFSSIALAEKAPVELVYCYWNNVGMQEYTKQVEDKINEMLKSTPGYEYITLRLNPIKDYSTTIQLMQSTGEQMDLYTSYYLNWVDEAMNGACIPLNDLLAANPEVTADLPDWLMQLGQIDGETYMIPNYQQACNNYLWATPTAYFEASGWTYDDVQQALWDRDPVRMVQFEEDLVKGVREKFGADKWLQPGLHSYAHTYTDWNSKLNTEFYYNSETGKVWCSYMDPVIQETWRQEAKWYVDGLSWPNQGAEPITKAVLADMMNERSYVLTRAEGNGTPEMIAQQFKKQYDIDFTVWPFVNHYLLPMRNSAGGVMISQSCKHPEEAAKVLALLFNSKYADIYTTLCWGLEGIHYTDNGDGTVITKEFAGSQGGAETTYCYLKWVGGNTFNAKNNQSLSPEQEQFILDVVNTTEGNTVNPLAGMVVDTTMITNELAQVKALQTEYVDSFQRGEHGENFEAKLEEYNQKMQVAGIQRILDELQSQVDKFLAK